MVSNMKPKYSADMPHPPIADGGSLNATRKEKEEARKMLEEADGIIARLKDKLLPDVRSSLANQLSLSTTYLLYLLT